MAKKGSEIPRIHHDRSNVTNVSNNVDGQLEKSPPQHKKPSKATASSSKGSPAQKSLKCVAWNIRGGLIKRRKEITNLLKKERIDVVFLTECDIRHIGEKNPYNIEGYKTFYPLI